jgi:hypothetical protein
LTAELEKLITQRGKGAVGADLRRADTNVEQAGDLVVPEMLETVQGQDLPLVQRQLSECGPHQSKLIRARSLFVGADGRRVSHPVQVDRIGWRGQVGLASKMVSGDFACEVIEPGGELAFVAIGVAVLEDTVEYQLDEILRSGLIIRQTYEETEERVVMPLEQIAQSGEFAGSHGDHQGMVTRFVHGRINARRSRSWRNWKLVFGQHGVHGARSESWTVKGENRGGGERLRTIARTGGGGPVLVGERASGRRLRCALSSRHF